MADNDNKTGEDTTNDTTDNVAPEERPATTDTPGDSEDVEQAGDKEENKAESDGEDAKGGETKNEEPDAKSTEQSANTPVPTDTIDETDEQKESVEQNESQPEPEETKTDTKQSDAELTKVKEDSLIAKEQLDKKIQENEALQQELKSALSNQGTESEAYKRLTEENARLQKKYDDIKEKYDDIEGGHLLLVAELETTKKVSAEQRDTIQRLEAEVKFLRETQGGDEVVKDLQDKLIRMSNEQEEKDKKIHSLEGELDTTKEKLKDAESRAARGGNAEAPKSKTCVVM